MLRRLVSATAVLTLIPLPCFAGTPQEKSIAETLFTDAQRLMSEGKFEEACSKFEDSLRLDDAGGTQLNLANCYSKSGRTASAWVTFRLSLSRAKREGRAERVQFAEEALLSLESRLSRVSLHVELPPVCAEPKVTIDGVEIPRAAWNLAAPYDPGSHEVLATAKGCSELKRTIVVDASRRNAQVDLILSAIATDPSPSKSPPPELPVVRPIVAQPAETTAVPNTPEKESSTWLYFAGGIGLIGVGLGTGFGISAMNNWNARNEHCAIGCDAEAVSYWKSADTNATASTVAFAAGGLALGIAGYLFFAQGSGAADKDKSRAAIFEVAPLLSERTQGVKARMSW